LLVAVAAVPFALSYPVTAHAHCEVGGRIFASTLTLDDPRVSDELSLPTIQSFKNGDVPSAQELEISGEYTKTITRNFGVSFEETWVHLNPPGEGSHSGFDNLGTSFKYQFVRDAGRELAMSASLDVAWGGTGAKSIGTEPFTTLTPTWFVGKGFLKLLRPLAVTTELGYSFPTQSSTTEFADGILTEQRNPQFLVWGVSLQYDMPYLKARVQDFGLPKFVNRLVPITEFSFKIEAAFCFSGSRTSRALSGINGAPHCARGRPSSPSLALSLHVSEHSSPRSHTARVLTRAACGRTPPHPKANRRRV